MDTPAIQQPILFISDAHLGGFSEAENTRIESELIQLINYCQRNSIRLAVLGDLFDYWMEYPDYVPNIGQRLLTRFQAFNQKLGPTLFITGNHDNWTRSRFEECGFYLVHETHRFDIHGQTVLALHGDGLNDRSYNLQRPLLHKILRNKTFVRIFQTILPPTAGITIMKYYSRFTRNLDWDPYKEEKLNRWAREQLKKNEIEVILCGHDHIPRQKQFPFGTFINLGTFYQHRTLAFYNNNTISLVCWEPHRQVLKQLESSSN